MLLLRRTVNNTCITWFGDLYAYGQYWAPGATRRLQSHGVVPPPFVHAKCDPAKMATTAWPSSGNTYMTVGEPRVMCGGESWNMSQWQSMGYDAGAQVERLPNATVWPAAVVEKILDRSRAALGLSLKSDDGASRPRAGPRSDMLNVHLIPHSHDDPGWVKTVDEYWYGADKVQDNGGGAVQYIYDTVIDELLRDPRRTFSAAEQVYFSRWWREQDEKIKEQTRGLVRSGQLVFVDGAWVQHDEACPDFVSMIEQTTLGHTFLKREFNYTPSVGWQQDPFGHSATQASLLSAEVGFDSLFFARIDYQDFTERVKRREVETVWRSSPSLGPEAEVFTGIAFNFGKPHGYRWHLSCILPRVPASLRGQELTDRITGCAGTRRARTTRFWRGKAAATASRALLTRRSRCSCPARGATAT